MTPSATEQVTEQVTDKTAIRPFRVNVPEAELTELRRRINATRWPERETDPSQGVQLATIQKLARYWATDYDWRKAEARLNALPQFITEIDGLDIHFIHVRSKHENALPLIVTHGWPGSVLEQLKIVDPLTNPTAHGASASDAFHLVIPSMPGYGFSGKPTTTGWDPARIARAWVTLMKRLGYTKFVAQGGDWGALITDLMGAQAPPELLGIHTNMPGAVPPEIAEAALAGAPAPAGLSADERHAYEQLSVLLRQGSGATPSRWGNRPQTLYGIADSPVGLAAWMLDHDERSYELIARVFDGQPEGLTRDDILDNITLFWLTNTAISAARLYWENKLHVPHSQERLDPGRRERLPGRALSSPAELGRAGVSRNSSTTTSSTKAGTSRPGSSRKLFQKRFARASDHCAVVEQWILLAAHDCPGDCDYARVNNPVGFDRCRSADTPTTPIVFVVDDDISVRESLELLIEASGWKPETFASAQAFLARPRPLVPSCLVLDVTLPDFNGLDLQRRVAVERSDMPVIFIAGHGDVPTSVQAMKAGAIEFLTKPFDEDVLLSAIERALERSRRVLEHNAKTKALRESYASLTPREREVMVLVTSGLLNKQVGGELGISEITVKAHRGQVMRKMKADSLPALVNMVATLGLSPRQSTSRGPSHGSGLAGPVS